ncbi:hypothetical protein ACFL6U_02015, partial [Planctomycetota bacterium]
WLDDDLSAEMLDELVEIAAADPLKMQRLREHLLFSDLLSQYEDQMRDPQQFLSALRVRAHAADDTEDFVNQVVASVNDETGGGLRSGFVATIAAASLGMAAVSPTGRSGGGGRCIAVACRNTV